jgi:two-component system phosphate regulon response regulator PhoB
MTTRVLLATPYADEQAIYGEWLRADGFDVRVAANVHDAFLQLLGDPVDVVVVRMPQPGGPTAHLDLLTRLREQDRTKSVPIVILTSMMEAENRAAATNVGCDGYLLLPALPDALAREVRRVTHQGGGSRAGR